MHNDLRKLKIIQKNRNRELSRFRYAYEDEPPTDDLKEQLRSMFQSGEMEVSQVDEEMDSDGVKNMTNGFDMVGRLSNELDEVQRSRGGAKTAMDSFGTRQQKLDEKVVI